MGAGMEGVTTHHVLPSKRACKTRLHNNIFNLSSFSFGFQPISPQNPKFYPYICPQKTLYSASGTLAVPRAEGRSAAI